MDQPNANPNPLALIITIDPEVVFERRGDGESNGFVAHDHRSGKFFRFGLAEYHAASLMDGKHDLQAIVDILARDQIGWNAADLVGFVRELMTHRLASLTTPPVSHTEVSEKTAPSKELKSAGQVSNDQSPADSNHELSPPQPSRQTKPTNPEHAAAVASAQANTGDDPSPQQATISSSSPQDQVETTSQAKSPTTVVKRSGKPIWVRLVSALGMLLSQRVNLVNGDRIAYRLLPLLGITFQPVMVAVAMMLVWSGVWLTWNHWESFSHELRNIFDPQMWVLMAVIWCALKIAHECGHAVCAKRQHVHVGSIGVIFFLCAPIPFVDVTDAWKLSQRRKRVQIALAGIYWELILGALAIWVWWLAPAGMVKHIAAQVAIIAGPGTLLVNLNPLLRLDGYYVLSDLLDIPNLRQVGRRRVAEKINYVLFGLPLADRRLTGWRATFAQLHAVASVIFQAVWISGILYALSMWRYRVGLALGAAAVFLWIVLPVLRWMHMIWTIGPRDSWVLNVYQRRLLAICSFSCLGVHTLLVQSSPFDLKVPVVVQYQDPHIARASTDGFVKAVYVHCGQRVRRGTLLLEIEQPELLLERDRLQDQRELALQRANQYQLRGQLALAAGQEETATRLQRQLSEIESQIEDLTVVAHRDGIITTPRIDHFQGDYVEQGQELVCVSDPIEKELLIAVSQDDVPAYRDAFLNGQLANIRMRGGSRMFTKLGNVAPNASNVLPHPALAVTRGGPIAVETTAESQEPTMVRPHASARMALDSVTSLGLKAGQVGQISIPDNRSLLSHLWTDVVLRQ